MCTLPKLRDRQTNVVLNIWEEINHSHNHSHRTRSFLQRGIVHWLCVCSQLSTYIINTDINVFIHLFELGLRYKKMYWLIGRNSSLSLHNKLLVYKQILKPVSTYGIQIWGYAKQSNIDIIQRFQDKVLRNIASAPWYIRNSDLHRDLKWTLCLAKSRDLHKSTKKDSTIMRTLRPYSSWTTWV